MYRQQYPEAPGLHNMPSGFTRTVNRHEQSFCERTRHNLIGVLIGACMLASACCLLFWNEGRAVRINMSLLEAVSQTHPLVSIDVPLIENNRKLVYLSGPLHVQLPKVLKDKAYGIRIQAVKLKREVHMFQWVSKWEYETSGVQKEDVSYSYYKEWKKELVDSSSFYNPKGHHNPVSFPLSSQEEIAKEVKVGHFSLSEALLDQISNYQVVDLTRFHHNNVVKVDGDSFYHGANSSDPQVGDLKVRFFFAGKGGEGVDGAPGDPDIVSIIAKQMNSKLLPFETRTGEKIEILYIGEHSAEAIFSREMAHNTMLTWGIRSAGWLLMFIGFGCLTNIFHTLVGWIPILRDLVAMGLNMMNICLAISLSLTVISISWIYYRPVIGMIILIMALSPFVWTHRRSEQRRYRSV